MKIIKKVLEEGFRYRVSGILLFVSIVVSMVSAYYSICIYYNINADNEDFEKYKYNSTIAFQYTGEEKSNIEISEDAKCEVKQVDYPVYLNDINTTHLVNIVIHSYKEKMPLVEGHYPTREEIESGKPIVVIGKKYLKNTKEKGEKRFFTIFGDEYEVVGVVSTENSKAFDSKILMYKGCIGEHFYNVSENEYGEELYSISSDEIDVREFYAEEIQSKYDVGYCDQSVDYFASGDIEPVERVFFDLMFVFCLVILLFAIKFWLLQRKHEIAVCRACGYGKMMIYGRIYKSLHTLCLISFFCAFLFIVILNSVFSSSVDSLNFSISLKYVVVFMAVYMIILTILCLRSIGKAYRKSIVEAMVV